MSARAIDVAIIPGQDYYLLKITIAGWICKPECVEIEPKKTAQTLRFRRE